MMRKLVLYSDQIYPATEVIDRRVIAMTGKEQPRIGYVPAGGVSSWSFYQDRQAYYARYGAELPVCLNLDHDFRPDRVDELLACDAIHLSGGNTFYFLHWLRKRRMLDPLRQYVREGGVLVGISAGAILMTPEIGTSLLCGDRSAGGLSDFTGLELVDFLFLPHFGRFSTDLDGLGDYARQRRATMYACPDGAGIVIEDELVSLIGDVVAIQPDENERQ